MLVCQVSNGAEQPKKQQRSDLNVPLENNNVPEVRYCTALLQCFHYHHPFAHFHCKLKIFLCALLHVQKMCVVNVVVDCVIPTSAHAPCLQCYNVLVVKRHVFYVCFCVIFHWGVIFLSVGVWGHICAMNRFKVDPIDQVEWVNLTNQHQSSWCSL